jgi:hypothetical protein
MATEGTELIVSRGQVLSVRKAAESQTEIMEGHEVEARAYIC